MTPANYPMQVQQGDTFTMVFTLLQTVIGGTPVDLTGCVAELAVRQSYASAVVYLLSSAAPTANGGTLTLGGTLGTIAALIPPADTLTLATGNYALRVKFPDGSIRTYLEGSITVQAQVSQWV